MHVPQTPVSGTKFMNNKSHVRLHLLACGDATAAFSSRLLPLLLSEASSPPPSPEDTARTNWAWTEDANTCRFAGNLAALHYILAVAYSLTCLLAISLHVCTVNAPSLNPLGLYTCGLTLIINTLTLVQLSRKILLRCPSSAFLAFLAFSQLIYLLRHKRDKHKCQPLTRRLTVAFLLTLMPPRVTQSPHQRRFTDSAEGNCQLPLVVPQSPSTIYY